MRIGKNLHRQIRTRRRRGWDFEKLAKFYNLPLKTIKNVCFDKRFNGDVYFSIKGIK